MCNTQYEESLQSLQLSSRLVSGGGLRQWCVVRICTHGLSSEY